MGMQAKEPCWLTRYQCVMPCNNMVQSFQSMLVQHGQKVELQAMPATEKHLLQGAMTVSWRSSKQGAASMAYSSYTSALLRFGFKHVLPSVTSFQLPALHQRTWAGYRSTSSTNRWLFQQAQHRLLRDHAAKGCSFVAVARAHLEQHERYLALREKWCRLEARFTALINGMSLSNSGQKVLISMLPIAITSQLFPGRFKALALSPPSIVWKGQAERKPSSFLSELLAQVTLPQIFHQIHREMQIWLRGIYLLLLFSPVMLFAPAALWAGGTARAAWMELICWCLERAGPAFIKWGQWSSTRPDLFPPDLCNAMERLQTSAPSHTPSYSRSVITRSFNAPVAYLFEQFEDEPVASGSIAQIHRARLSAAGAALTQGKYKAGTTVAVKIRHPGVTRLMEHDFILMERAAQLLSSLPGLNRLDESVRQFGAPLKEQLDLKIEAQHLSRFKHNFRLWPNVSFPTPLYPLVSSDVLVETFEDGALISKYVNQPTYAHRGLLAETGLACYLQMLLRDNFIHADLHPGNILVKEFDSRGTWVGWLSRQLMLNYPPKLVLLDVGMIAQLSKADQGHLISFFKALTKQDGEELGTAILGMSEQHTCKNPDAFIASLKSMFDSLDPEFIHRHTSSVIESIIDTVREHEVTLRSAVSTVVVTTLVLEGWSSKLNPDMRILDYMRDILVVDWNERISRTVDKLMRNGSLVTV